MKLLFSWKVLFGSLAIIGVLATSLGYIVGVSSLTMTTGIKVWNVTKKYAVTTTSTSYIVVPGMKLTIDAPVGTNLVITFTVRCGVPSGLNFLYGRLIVDGSAVFPKDVNLTYNGVYGTRSFTWVKHVTAGTHTIKIKWKVAPSVLGVMNDRSLVVLANSYKAFE